MEEFEVEIDEAGRVVLPPELAKRFGLSRSTRIRMSNGSNGLRFRLPVTHLGKIYIEPTNRCNLDCVTCMRNSWDEPLGEMSNAVFSRIVEGLRSLSQPPDILFGGLGEPLAHPDIVEMVKQTKALASSVELVTNGTLLSKSLSKQLIDAGLDILWVSLDGATPASYKDVRLGAALPDVLANLASFREARWNKYYPAYLDHHLKPQLGIVFVAMKRNIGDLPEVISLGNRLGSRRFLVTNVLPYTREMHDEILYVRALDDGIYASSPWICSLDLPKIDINPATYEVMYRAMLGNHSLNIAGGSLGERNNLCPFIDKGALAIRWDGDASPCLALLHDHRQHLYRFERAFRRYAVGNVTQQSLGDIWENPQHMSFRNRVQEFDFSPCTSCGGCDLLESNEEDCIGSPFPACGGCLWAQGIVQCP